jgi:hypothetical protein
MPNAGTSGNCRLVPTPADPNCDFKAPQGPSSVTLEVKGTTGSVQFLKVDYNGTKIVDNTPTTTITFAIASGMTNLDVVYVFSDTTNGKGTLNEVCSANTLLKNVSANNPAVRYVICA